MNYRVLLLLILPLTLEACFLFNDKEHTNTNNQYSLIDISLTNGRIRLTANTPDGYVDYPLGTEYDPNIIWKHKIEDIRFYVDHYTQTDSSYDFFVDRIQLASTSCFAHTPAPEYYQLMDTINSISITTLYDWNDDFPAGSDISDITNFAQGDFSLFNSPKQGTSLSRSYLTIYGYPEIDSFQIAVKYSLSTGETISDTSELCKF